MQEPAHGEDGRLVPTQDFDYVQVEENLFGGMEGEIAELSQEDVDRALKVLDMLLRWIWQDGTKNHDGVKIRAIIICWVFIKELRPMTLTEMAAGYDLKKQSLGRWFDEFKKDFKGVRTSHMR